MWVLDCVVIIIIIPPLKLIVASYICVYINMLMHVYIYSACGYRYSYVHGHVMHLMQGIVVQKIIP